MKRSVTCSNDSERYGDRSGATGRAQGSDKDNYLTIFNFNFQYHKSNYYKIDIS